MLYAFFWVIPPHPNGSDHFQAKPFPVYYPNISQTSFNLHTYLPMKMEQSVPKRRHIHFRRQGITQKKAYNVEKRFETDKYIHISEDTVYSFKSFSCTSYFMFSERIEFTMSVRL
jgi:hypothetical protein